MEHLCYYVNSRGLLKSCNFHSPNPKSSCNDDKGYLYQMLDNKPTSMFDGMSIYVCSNLLGFFVMEIMPKLNYKFVLVSGDSDSCVPREELTQTQLNSLLGNNLLIRWFAQNTQQQDLKKLVQMPIGLDYHTVSQDPNHKWLISGENHLPRFQEKTIMDIKNSSPPFQERTPLIYINMTISTNDRFRQRRRALEVIPKELCVINQDFTPRTTNWKKMAEHAFVLSPTGNGLDTHRTWEALCLGCIPILCLPSFKRLMDGLPVLIVKDWNEITETLLKETIEKFSNMEFQYNKLTLNYWVKRIRATE